LLKQIFINTRNILHNRKTGDRRPVVTVRKKAGALIGRSNTVLILHEGREVARGVYRPDDPLPSGPTCWIETTGDVELAPLDAHRADPEPDADALAGSGV